MASRGFTNANRCAGNSYCRTNMCDQSVQSVMCCSGQVYKTSHESKNMCCEARAYARFEFGVTIHSSVAISASWYSTRTTASRSRSRYHSDATRTDSSCRQPEPSPCGNAPTPPASIANRPLLAPPPPSPSPGGDQSAVVHWNFTDDPCLNRPRKDANIPVPRLHMLAHGRVQAKLHRKAIRKRISRMNHS